MMYWLRRPVDLGIAMVASGVTCLRRCPSRALSVLAGGSLPSAKNRNLRWLAGQSYFVLERFFTFVPGLRPSPIFFAISDRATV